MRGSWSEQRIGEAVVLMAILVGLSPLAAGAEGWRVEPVPEGVRFVSDSGAELSRLAVGEVVDVKTHAEVAYVALSAGGVVIIRVATPAHPEVVGRLAEGRRIQGLVVSGGQLLLLEARLEAHAFSLEDPARPRPTVALLAPPAPVPSPVSSTAPAGPPAEGATRAPQRALQVVGVTQGRVLFEGGREDGIAEGMRVRVISQRLVQVPDLTTGGSTSRPSGETTAVVQVEHAEARRSMARLGRGDVAEVGDLVEVTSAPLSERLLAPRRAPFSAQVGFHLRPFFGVGTNSGEGSSKPFGVLADLFGSYYFPKVPVRLELSASPLGFVVGARDRHQPLTFALTGAYTTDFFEIGLGAGALVGEPGPCSPEEPRECEENTGFTFNQFLRLGALDGLNVTWQSSIFSRPEEFPFGGGRAELNVPLSSRLGLFAAGGGGENGWAFGELGVRTYVGGAGARGTLIISASLGVASILDGPAHEQVIGPAIAFGMEWRL